MQVLVWKSMGWDDTRQGHTQNYETTRMNVLSQMFDRVVNTPLQLKCNIQYSLYFLEISEDVKKQ